ncbi:MAG: hypothetical protein HY831_01205 [Candidatus Aenigmarchaeota archaeon]|nr:hypothetical protein [Candidatus Aenigmarchaeota archaeon]
MKNKILFILLIILVLSGYSYAQTCGNNVIEKGEECEINDIGNASCSDYGFQGGSLTCKGCVLDTNDCISPVYPSGKFISGNSSDMGLSLTPLDIALIVAVIVIIVGSVLYIRHNG